MGDKCEWKAEQVGNKPAAWKFEPCDGMHKAVEVVGFANDLIESADKNSWQTVYESIIFQHDNCPFCGADIRKPEPPKEMTDKVATSFIIFDGTTGETKEAKGIFKNLVVDKLGIGEYTLIPAKPEPAEPLIVKSGGTWIYFAEGINYICIDPHIYTKSRPLNLNDFYSEIIHWKSFTGPNPDITELTDEIAKLRPIVRNTILIDCLYTLYGVTCGMGIVTGLEKPDLLRWIEMDHCRLATAQELQE